MKITKIFIVLISIIFCFVHSAIILSVQPSCISVSSSGICTKCQNSYLLDDTGNCNLILTQCLLYQANTNVCVNCQQGYTAYKNNCILTAYTQVYDPFCNRFLNNICQQCSFGYFFNSLGRCTASDYSCKAFNMSNGQCTNCYRGYILLNGTCEVQNNFSGITDFCKVLSNKTQNNKTVCRLCDYNYTLNSLSICQPYPSNCIQYDTDLGVCSTCSYGYQYNILTKVCQQIIGNITPIINSYCQQWSNNQCMMCYPKFAFDINNICVVPSSQCKQASSNGSCLSCFEGWNLTLSFQCEVNVNYVYNSLCQTFQNGICSSCSYRSIMSKNGICVPINQLCLDFNSITGSCLSCYLGYTLINLTCVIQDPNHPSTSNLCSIYDATAGICKLCIPWTYLAQSQKVCLQVSDQCRTFNNLTGFCTSCYVGYVLNLANGECIVSNNSKLINCKQFQNDSCTLCIYDYQFDQFHNCINLASVSVPPTNYNFTLNLTNSVNNNNFCVKYDINFTCILCQINYKLINGQCAFISPNCQSTTYNQTSNILQCNACSKNYTLVDGNCYTNIQLNPLCQIFNGNKCKECSFRSVFDSQGKCIAVSDLCATWDSKGNCLSCYWGYVLKDGSCIIGQN